MKITIDSIEISEDKVKTVARIEEVFERIHENTRYSKSLSEAVLDLVTEKLAEKLILERGPEILSLINTNQLLNAIVMKSSGMMFGK